MKIRFLGIVLTIIFVFIPVTISADFINVTINGQLVNFHDHSPVLMNGRTLVPVRGVFETLGFDVSWNADTGMVLLTRNDYIVAITIESNTFTTNGVSHALDVPAQIINNRTMLPIRAVLESVGYFVSWNDATSTVIISSTPIYGYIPTSPPSSLRATRGTVASGDAFNLVIQSNGNLYSWGRNSNGRLGNGQSGRGEILHDPIRIMSDVVAVSAAGQTAMAIKSDGGLYAWGRNNLGQIGNGTTVNQYTPVRIMDDVAYVSVGATHVMAIKIDGSLWAWGSNGHFGLLGDGTNVSQYSPVKIMDDVVAVSAGLRHTMAIKTDGSLWGWGYHRLGALGIGYHRFGQPGVGIEAIFRNTPVRIMNNVVSVSAGADFTMAVTSDGHLWAWGFGGLLGDGTVTTRYTPVEILNNVTTVSISSHHTAAIRTDGSLWTWGRNENGEVGDGTTIFRSSPVRVMENIIFVSTGARCWTGANTTMAIQSDGSLWIWGSGSNSFRVHTESNSHPAMIMSDVLIPH